MTLTLRIPDNSETAQQLEWIKKYFNIKTNSDAIVRAIAYFSRFADHKLERDQRTNNYRSLETEINQYKQIFSNFINTIDRMRIVALKE